MKSSLWFAPVGIKNEKNVYFQARTEFELPAIPAQLQVRIAAESWYRLWCNESQVASGPARGNHALNFYDSLDLSPFLKAGKNRLRVLVGTTNEPTFKIAPARPALWVEVEDTQLIWQVARDESFDSQSAVFNFQTGYCEWRDLRVAALDWQAPEFFAIEKQLLPRDCRMLEVSHHQPLGATFPIALQAGEPVVFEFAQEIIGGAEIEVLAVQGIKVEVGYGEYLTEGRVNIYAPEINRTYADRFITREGSQILGATLQERGYRFLQITATGPLSLVGLRGVDRRYPLPPPGFQCEDESFNRLYTIAHHTVSSCVTDTINDCPWREQALWMNDLVVNALFWLEAGGDPQMVARCLNLALSDLNPDGLIYGAVPNADRENIVFLATNAFLPLILLDLAERDAALAYSFLPQVETVIEALAQFADADGLLVGPAKYWNFLDWSFEFQQKDFFTGQASASINGFYILALQAMTQLHEQAGSDGKHWQQQADRLAANWHRRFWWEERQCYRELEAGEMCSELAQALACLINHAPAITATLCEKLAADSDELFKPELYMMHFVIRVLVENGHHEAAKARLIRYWGGMLEENSPTVWEANVHQHGREAFGRAGSLCHAFACAPLWALPRLYPMQERNNL